MKILMSLLFLLTFTPNAFSNVDPLSCTANSLEDFDDKQNVEVTVLSAAINAPTKKTFFKGIPVSVLYETGAPQSNVRVVLKIDNLSTEVKLLPNSATRYSIKSDLIYLSCKH